jgi:DnaJ-domain-containing protein 1
MNAGWPTRLRARLNDLQDRVMAIEAAGGPLAAARRRVDRALDWLDGLGSPSRQREVAAWYQTLGLPMGAGPEEVRQAYRALMRTHHPDRHAGSPAAERAATQRAQTLTVAHNGLLEYLRHR